MNNMANRNNKFVTIKVDANFFNNFFEPERKKLENKFNVRVGQVAFSKYLFNSRMIRSSKIKRGGFRFDL